MSQCTDKRFEGMLHAFEIGALDENDYREFQIHLLDCQYCFERALKMQAAVELLRDDSDFERIAGRIVKENADTEPGTQKEKEGTRSWYWPTLIPASLVAAAILVSSY